MNDPSKFSEAIRLIDEENSKDPNQDLVEGKKQPRELVYSRRLSEWIKKLAPDASEALLIAARGQHIARWSIPRNTYPMTRVGYLKWREDLKKFHAQKTSTILEKIGYDVEFIDGVKSLILKKNFPKDPEGRILEDALSLVFLEFQFSELAQKTESAKMVDILRKAWKKMTPEAQKAAQTIFYQPNEAALIQKALS